MLAHHQIPEMGGKAGYKVMTVKTKGQGFVEQDQKFGNVVVQDQIRGGKINVVIQHIQVFRNGLSGEFFP